MSGQVRVDWPDGGSYLEQEVFLVQIFDIIRDEMRIMKDG